MSNTDRKSKRKAGQGKRKITYAGGRDSRFKGRNSSSSKPGEGGTAAAATAAGEPTRPTLAPCPGCRGPSTGDTSTPAWPLPPVTALPEVTEEEGVVVGDGDPTVLPPALRAVGEVAGNRLDPRTARAVAPAGAAGTEGGDTAWDTGCGTGVTSRPGASRKGGSEEDHRS